MQTDNAVLFDLSGETGLLFRRLQVGRLAWLEHHGDVRVERR